VRRWLWDLISLNRAERLVSTDEVRDRERDRPTSLHGA
jgi:hypothetical protein